MQVHYFIFKDACKFLRLWIDCFEYRVIIIKFKIIQCRCDAACQHIYHHVRQVFFYIKDFELSFTCLRRFLDQVLISSTSESDAMYSIWLVIHPNQMYNLFWLRYFSISQQKYLFVIIFYAFLFKDHVKRLVYLGSAQISLILFHLLHGISES